MWLRGPRSPGSLRGGREAGAPPADDAPAPQLPIGGRPPRATPRAGGTRGPRGGGAPGVLGKRDVWRPAFPRSRFLAQNSILCVSYRPRQECLPATLCWHPQAQPHRHVYMVTHEGKISIWVHRKWLGLRPRDARRRQKNQLAHPF